MTIHKGPQHRLVKTRTRNGFLIPRGLGLFRNIMVNIVSKQRNIAVCRALKTPVVESSFLHVTRLITRKHFWNLSHQNRCPIGQSMHLSLRPNCGRKLLAPAQQFIARPFRSEARHWLKAVSHRQPNNERSTTAIRHRAQCFHHLLADAHPNFNVQPCRTRDPKPTDQLLQFLRIHAAYKFSIILSNNDYVRTK